MTLCISVGKKDTTKNGDVGKFSDHPSQEIKNVKKKSQKLGDLLKQTGGGKIKSEG